VTDENLRIMRVDLLNESFRTYRDLNGGNPTRYPVLVLLSRSANPYERIKLTELAGNRCHTIRKPRWHRIPGPGALPADLLDAIVATTEGPGVDVGQPHANLIMLVDVTASPLVGDLR
jgi:hypothetical protein